MTSSSENKNSLAPAMAFMATGLLWGSSYLWIKIGIVEVGPFGLVAWRLLMGATGLYLFLLWKKKTLPTDFKTWKRIITMSLVHPLIPFLLIAWGEQYIDSGIAAIFGACVPLFAAILAYFFAKEERLTAIKSLGVAIGFLGTTLLVFRDFKIGGPTTHASTGGPSETLKLLGNLAAVVATSMYAIGALYSKKKLSHLNPIVQSTSIMISASILSWCFYLATGGFLVPSRPETLIAISWLGLLGTSTAFMLYFYLIQSWGATQSSLVNYLFPIVGLVLGVTFMGETLNSSMILGSTLIILGIFIVRFGNVRFTKKI